MRGVVPVMFREYEPGVVEVSEHGRLVGTVTEMGWVPQSTVRPVVGVVVAVRVMLLLKLNFGVNVTVVDPE